MSAKNSKTFNNRLASHVAGGSYGPEAFQGLHLGIDPSRLAMRTVSHEDSYKERRRRNRATEGKIFGDMKRQNRVKLTQAMKPGKLGNLCMCCHFHHITYTLPVPVTLNFRVSDFQKQRNLGKIPMRKAKPFRELAKEAVHLSAGEGARLVVDLDGVVVFYYAPGYISDNLGVSTAMPSRMLGSNLR